MKTLVYLILVSVTISEATHWFESRESPTWYQTYDPTKPQPKVQTKIEPKIKTMWSPWQAWSPCSTTCGEGKMIKRRTKVQKLGNKIISEIDSETEIVPCNIYCKKSNDICHRLANFNYHSIPEGSPKTSNRLLVKIPIAQDCFQEVKSLAHQICQKSQNCCLGKDDQNDATFIEMVEDEYCQLKSLTSCPITRFAKYPVKYSVFHVNYKRPVHQNAGPTPCPKVLGEDYYQLKYLRSEKNYTDEGEFEMEPWARLSNRVEESEEE